MEPITPVIIQIDSSIIIGVIVAFTILFNLFNISDHFDDRKYKIKE